MFQLPLKVDIIKHPSEVDGKSTSAHGKVLAPTDVEIFTYPCIPDYPRDGSVSTLPRREGIGGDKVLRGEEIKT